MACIDLMRIGGISGWLRGAGVAAGAGLQLSSHIYPEVAAHLLRVTPTAHCLDRVDWAQAIIAGPMQPVDGRIVPPSRPGLGFNWNEAAIAKYAVAVQFSLEVLRLPYQTINYATGKRKYENDFLIQLRLQNLPLCCPITLTARPVSTRTGLKRRILVRSRADVQLTDHL